MKTFRKISESIGIVPPLVLVLLLIPMMVQNRFSLSYLVSIIQQSMIYYPAILAQLLYLMIGNIHFSIGGSIVLGIQLIAYLYLVLHLPLWIGFWIVVIIYTIFSFFASYFYDSKSNTFEIFTFALIFITKGLSDYIYTKINVYPIVSSAMLSQNDNLIHSPVIVTVLISVPLFLYLNYTYQGKASAYIPLLKDNKPYKNHSFQLLMIISCVLIVISSYLLMKRTGIPNIHDSLDLNYLLLTAGIMGHNQITSKNIIMRAILCSLCMVTINSTVFFLAITPMARYCIYGALVLLSYTTFQGKSKNRNT